MNAPARPVLLAALVSLLAVGCVVEPNKSSQPEGTASTAPTAPTPPTRPTDPTPPPRPGDPPTPTDPTPATDCPDSSSSAVTYTSDDPTKCASLRFKCATGETAFSNTCGCGCVAAADKTPSCPDASAAGVDYKSTDANQCARMKFGCPAGSKPFSSGECGCGCEPAAEAPPTPAKCPEAAISGVDYKSKDTSFCARARIVCGEGQKPFSSECGCGCVPK